MRHLHTPLNKQKACFFVFLLFALLYSSALPAQESSQATKAASIYSMGLSSKSTLYWGPMFVIDQPGAENTLGGQLYAGLNRYIISPLFGIGLGIEGYVEAFSDHAHAAKLVQNTTARIFPKYLPKRLLWNRNLFPLKSRRP